MYNEKIWNRRKKRENICKCRFFFVYLHVFCASGEMWGEMCVRKARKNETNIDKTYKQYKNIKTTQLDEIKRKNG